MEPASHNASWKDDVLLPGPSSGSRNPNVSTNKLPKMQPLSFMLGRRRYRRLLSILAISTTSFVLLKLWGMTTWTAKYDLDDPYLFTNELIPYPTVHDQPPIDSNLPPLYQQYRQYEDLLSNHYLSNQTGDEKYLSFENHAWGSGWGNVLQEMVFNSLLAWQSNRSYVWDDYTWNRNGSEYGEFNGKIIPARIPVSTMVAGHFLGFDARNSSSDKPPRPISGRIYNKVCPQRQRKSIQQNDVQKYFDRQNPGKNEEIGQLAGKQTLNLWVSYLESPEIRNVKCLEIQKDTPQIFHIWLLGSTRMQNLWGPLIRSPVLTNWGWSPLIYRAFLKNLHLFVGNEDKALPGWSGSFLDAVKNILPRSLSSTTTLLRSSVVSIKETSHSNLTDLSDVPREILDASVRLPILALHLRRGDFKDHCSHLAKYSSTYTGFNSFPDVAELDAFYVPLVANPASNKSFEVNGPNALLVDSEQGKYDIYYRHCFPDVQQIVQRVRDVVHDFEMDLRRQAQEHAADQPWWGWAGAKKDYRRRRASSSSVVGDTQTLQSTRDGSSSVRRPDVDSYSSYATRSTLPISSSPQVLRRAPRQSGLETSLTHKILRKVYIMSNGDQGWLKDVADALKDDAARSKVELGHREDGDWEFEFEWEDVGTSRDMDLGWEEKPVSQALDMYIAQRAEVFVGNGFSSMTSNVVMLRLKAGLRQVRTRFW